MAFEISNHQTRTATPQRSLSNEHAHRANPTDRATTSPTQVAHHVITHVVTLSRSAQSIYIHHPARLYRPPLARTHNVGTTCNRHLLRRARTAPPAEFASLRCKFGPKAMTGPSSRYLLLCHISAHRRMWSVVNRNSGLYTPRSSGASQSDSR